MPAIAAYLYCAYILLYTHLHCNTCRYTHTYTQHTTHLYLQVNAYMRIAQCFSITLAVSPWSTSCHKLMMTGLVQGAE